MKTIEEQIRVHALSNPDKAALIGDGREVTYRQLWSHSLAVAQRLHTQYGLEKGDRVVLSAAGSIEFVYCYLGAHIMGAIVVPIDPDTNYKRWEYIEASTCPKCVIGKLSRAATRAIEFDQVVNYPDEEWKYSPRDLNDAADILFTTGTTGLPKGVVLSYRNQSVTACQINEYIGNTENDVELLALPVSHSFGLGRLRCVLAKGGTLVMLGSFANVKRFFGDMKKYRVTGLGMVPASWGYIKKMSGNYMGRFAQQLRYVEIGSSYMPLDEKKLLADMLPSTRIAMHYGLTEASRSAFMEFHDDSDKMDSAGKPAPGVEIKIFSETGLPLDARQVGELCVKGGHVCSGYWNVAREQFAQDFYGDFFRTGDSAYMDEEGFIYLKSRIKELINVGGKKVSPVEVEEHLNAIPGIVESACVAIPDPSGIMGEVVKAFVVVTDDTLTEDTIMCLLTPHLEIYKLPVQVARIDEIPKTPSGKIQRLLLKNK